MADSKPWASEGDELQRVKSLLEVVLDGMGDGFAIYDRQFRFVLLGKVDAQLLRERGVDPHSVIGRVLWDVLPNLEGTEVEHKLKRTMEQRVRTCHELCFNGQWLELRAAPIRDGGIAVISNDITARKRAELALRESERQFRFLADNLPQLVWTARPDGTIDFVNQRWRALCGADDVWSAVLHPDDLARTTEAWARSVTEGEAFQAQARIRCGSAGRWPWFLIRAVPLCDERGRVTRWFGTATDVDEQHQASQRLAESLKVREDFLAVAGHELKTPLAALIMQVQGLARSIGSPDGTERLPQRLQRASAAGQRLARLVDELLDVSRITTGRLALDPRELDLVAMVQTLVATLADEAAEAGTAIALDVRDRAIVGQWDPVRVEQVVSNLIHNAMKYGRGRPIDVQLAREPAAAVLKVIDRGIGIAPAAQARIFERFERAVGARDYSGLGLGLWISRQIVEASGGEICVDSEPGVGSTFTVKLPLARPGANALH